MAIPIVAGPGAMATAIIAAEHNPGIWPKLGLLLTAIELAVMVGALFAYSRPIPTKLGKSGMGVVTRVMGMVLTAIAIGMHAAEIKGLLPMLAS